MNDASNEQLRAALRKVCEHSARGSVVYQIAAGALACGCLETYPQLQAGRINHAPGCALRTDPERVEIVRCRCGGFPRPTLMGRTICSVCGQDVPQAVAAS